MHPELLLLSGQIALLVLIGSALAFFIGRWSGSKTSRALDESESQRLIALQHLSEVKAALATTEQHCVAALEQRDQAELQATHHATEARRLQEIVSAAQEETMRLRSAHEQALNDAVQLSEARTREAGAEAAKAKSELEKLRAESVSTSEHQTALREAGAKVAELEAAKSELNHLRQQTISKAEHEALVQKHAQAGSESDALRLQLQQLQQSTVSRADHENVRAELEAVTGQLQQLQQTTLSRAEHERALQEALELITERETTISTLTDQQAKLAQEMAAAKAQVQTLNEATIPRTDHEALLRKLTQEYEGKLAEKARQLEAAREAVTTPPAAPPAPPAHHLPPPSVLLPAPKPKVQIPATPLIVQDELSFFPPAPALSTVRRSLFKGIDKTPRPPEAGSIALARERLQQLVAELAEQQQLVLTLTEQTTAETDEHTLKLAAKKLAAATETRDRTARHVEAVKRSVAQAEAADARADDLTLIKGVKDALNKQLHTHGIFSYRQIAQWSPEDIQSFGELLAFKQRIHKDHWQQQARELHEARYEEPLS